MEVVNLVIKILLCVGALILITVVLMQDSQGSGASAAIMGGSGNNTMSKGKARGKDAMLFRLTKIVGIVFMVLAVALVLIQKLWLN